MRDGRAILRPLLAGGLVLAAAIVAACLLAPASAGAAAAPKQHAFVPADLLAAAEAEPQSVFAVLVQGRHGKASADVANEVAAERARTPGKGRGVGRRFVTISGVSAELTGRQILKLAKKSWILAITPDAPMVATVAPSNTAPPTLAGTTQEGQTLTASEGVWSGAPPFSYAYQWQRCSAAGDACVDIAAATAASFTLTATEVGATVRVVVTATDTGGSASAASAVSAVVAVPAPFAPANTVAPTVAGTAQDGAALSAGDGLWSGTFPLAYGYRWQRCSSAGDACVEIAGATASSFTLSAADVGATVRVVVTATNSAGSASATSAASAVVAPAPPANVSSPALSGTAVEGATLAGSSGAWSGTPPLTHAYQWQRCDAAGGGCVAIAGATASSYTLTAADVGSTVRVVVTASNSAGSASASSAVSAVVAAPPPFAPANSVPPTVAGSALEGAVLTATEGLWSGTFPLAFAYQWQRCDAAGGGCIAIAGATSSSYTLTAADVGSTMRVAVTATNGAGSATAASAVSSVVAAPAPSPPANTTPPTVAGTAQHGATLSTSDGLWTGTLPVAYSYQWRRCSAVGDACADLAGATGSTYTLTAADVGATVRVVVTAVNGGGSASTASAASAVVTAAPPASVSVPLLSGTAEDGQTLQATAGGWTGTPPLAYVYQWQRCSAAGDACVDIAGAAASSFTLSAADVGSTVRVTVTATNGTGSSSAASAVSAVVAPAPPVSVSVPLLSGTAADGATLTASNGGWSGTAPLTYGYQWQRCTAAGDACVDVAGAAGSSLTLSASDLGSTVRVVVTATNGVGSASAWSAVSAAVAPAPPVSVSVPVLSGTAEDGATLTASSGGWSGTAPLTYGYQWQRCSAAGDACVEITGATASTHTLSAAEVGATVRVAVTASNGGGSATAVSAASTVVASVPPVSVSAPALSGTAQDGVTLTASSGGWSGTAPLTYGYQWRRCSAAGDACVDIAGATASTYMLSAAEIGSTVRVAVTAGNVRGSATAVSAASTVVTSAPPVSVSAPALSGTAADGQILQATAGSWTGTPPLAHGYQWQRCDAAGNGCVEITGATASSYALTAVDVGATVRVAVTASNTAGSASAVSAVSAVVAPPLPVAPANTVPPTLTGTAQDGATLGASEGLWSGTFPLAYAYQWQRCSAVGDGCVEIAGAAASTYALTGADVGSTVRVSVTASNGGGSVTAVSAASVLVVAAPPASTSAPVLSGTAVDGATLTASSGAWSGTAPFAYSYRWERCSAAGDACVEIAGATTATYTLGAPELGSTVRVVVTASNGVGSASAVSAVSALVASAPPVNVSVPVLSGTAVDGATLTASSGTWSGTAPLSYSYRWQRCSAAGDACVEIAGATAATYTLSGADAGSTVRVVVAASNAAGSVSAASVVSALVASLPPANTVPPTLTGTAQDGATLGASEGLWSGTFPLAYAYQWQRCSAVGDGCVEIAGAAASTYALTGADVGSTVRVSVTASNGGGSVTAVSAASVLVVAAPPASTSAPVLSGTAVDAQTLHAAAGSWTGTPPLAFTYQWQRCGAAGDACVEIAGATTATYTLGAAELGSTVRVVVTASNGAGSATAVSAVSALVASAPPVNVSAPVLSGTAVDGATLTISSGAWSGTAPLDYSYRWQRCSAAGDACVEIVGATSSSYALSGADAGSTVRVVVTATNAAGSASAASVVSALVASLPPASVSMPALSGTAEDGQTLQATMGSWTGTQPLAFAYRWQRCSAAGDGCVEIAGAAASSYTLTGADAGSTVRVVVTASNGGGSATAVSAVSALVASAPPVSISVPVLVGTAVDGATLTASSGAWTGTAPLAYSYQWQRCTAAGDACVEIAGATTATYTLGAAELGSTVRVAVAASNSAGSASALSAMSAVIASAPPANVSVPVLSGTAVDGATLTAASGEWSGTAPLAYSYRWQRCSAAGDACVEIAGATTATYTLSAVEVGSTVRVAVTATNSGGSATAHSVVRAVAAAPPVSVSAPALSGTAADGGTLTASSGDWSGTAPLSYTFAWQRCNAAGDACAAIAGATASSYTLTAVDVGATIRVAVAAANTGGSGSAISAPSAPVEPLAPANVVRPRIVGVAEEGLMVTSEDGAWSGTPALSYSYQWRRCDADGASCVDLAGATKATYLLQNGDVGSTVRVVVTATNVAGSAVVVSELSAVIGAAPVLSGYSTRQVWPYASGVAHFWLPDEAAHPAIAIVDSGIDTTRADFGSRVVHTVTLTTLTPNSAGDGRGHGTFVASIAAGEAVGYTGADPRAKLVSIDVMDDSGKAMTSDVVAAADWIYTNKDAYDIRVSNFSLTGSVESSFRFDPVNLAVQKLWLSGIVVVAAAGNYAVGGAESGVGYSPGNDPFVITVGASDVNGSISTADDFAAPWSAYGYTVDGFRKPELGSPGRYIVGAVPPASRLATERPDRLVADGYMQLSGTSFAAPIVAGTAAALLAAHPTWTPDQVKGALMLTADATATSATYGIGVGAIDAAGAAAVADPPNANAALNQFLIPDPGGGSVRVFDEATWAATVQADATWAAGHWGSGHWGSASWSAGHWGSAVWSAGHWGSGHWGSDSGESGADGHWGSTTNGAADDVLPMGGYWLTSAERAAAEEVLAQALAAKKLTGDPAP